MTARAAMIAAVAAVAVAACGEAPPVAPPATRAQLHPSWAVLAYPGQDQALNDPTLAVRIILTNRPDAVFYPRVVADAPVLSSLSVAAIEQADGSFVATLTFNRRLPAGRHAGRLSFQLCQDRGCALQYPLAGGAMPYRLTVTPGIEITATVNGIAARLPLTVKDGDAVVLQSSAPVQWIASSSGASAQAVVGASMSWSGTLRHALPQDSGGTGLYSVQALTPAASQAARATAGTSAMPQASRETHIFVTP